VSDDSLFHEWRAADRKAHALERTVTKASLRALGGEGEAPTAHEREKVRTLRQAADELFHLAMKEFKLRVARLRA
jgi:hypothetical protein